MGRQSGHIEVQCGACRQKVQTVEYLAREYIPIVGAAKKKGEVIPELAQLLEDNFIQYDGKGDVPSQIHSLLSTNFKDLRSLEKDDPRLMAKAKDRWYVPDPNKSQDLEKKREKSLLKEFEAYRSFTGRKLKEFRLLHLATHGHANPLRPRLTSTYFPNLKYLLSSVLLPDNPKVDDIF